MASSNDLLDIANSLAKLTPAPASENNILFPFNLSCLKLMLNPSYPTPPPPPQAPKLLSKARAKKARKARQQTLSSSQPRHRPLRPAKDILSRIRHDPALDNAEFIVGYHDQHADVMELPVAAWKGGGDVTEEEFIPQHRILCFRRKENGVKMWDRKEKVDLLFGSGYGAGKVALDKGEGKELNEAPAQGELEGGVENKDEEVISDNVEEDLTDEEEEKANLRE